MLAVYIHPKHVAYVLYQLTLGKNWHLVVQHTSENTGYIGEGILMSGVCSEENTI